VKQHGQPVAQLVHLDDLRALARHPGPFLSVHLPFGTPDEDTLDRVEVEWGAHRNAALDAGATDEVITIVDEVIEGEPYRLGVGVSVIAAPGASPVIQHLPISPAVELVSWGRVPAVRSLIDVRQVSRPHVVVLADRTGADLLVRGAGLGATREVDITGDDYPVHKVAGGGWAQWRIQRRAEDSWHQNMAAVATELAAEVSRSGAAVVAVGGDERAVGLLRDALPAGVSDLLRPIDVTRAADGTAENLDAEVERVLRSYVADELDAACAAYRRELGQHDRATAGPSDTFTALRAARVATLFTTVAADGGSAWLAGDHQQVGISPDDVLTDGDRWSAPLVDVAVSSALAAHADVRVVPDDQAPTGGIGALLRW
jgi:Bacterial archaeo-eukaryotic release factor family 2